MYAMKGQGDLAVGRVGLKPLLIFVDMKKRKEERKWLSPLLHEHIFISIYTSLSLHVYLSI